MQMKLIMKHPQNKKKTLSVNWTSVRFLISFETRLYAAISYSSFRPRIFLMNYRTGMNVGHGLETWFEPPIPVLQVTTTLLTMFLIKLTNAMLCSKSNLETD